MVLGLNKLIFLSLFASKFHSTFCPSLRQINSLQLKKAGDSRRKESFFQNKMYWVRIWVIKLTWLRWELSQVVPITPPSTPQHTPSLWTLYNFSILYYMETNSGTVASLTGGTKSINLGILKAWDICALTEHLSGKGSVK